MIEEKFTYFYVCMKIVQSKMHFTFHYNRAMKYVKNRIKQIIF